jgi:hypothetical protein
MKNSLNRRSLDNVTVVIIAFSGFKDTIANLNAQYYKQESLKETTKHEKRNTSYHATSKSQRSASQNQVLGGTRGFLTNNTLM